MEWKYLDKVQPNEGDDCLVYCLNGTLTVTTWEHAYEKTNTYGESYYSTLKEFGAIDIGGVFIPKRKNTYRCNPIKNVVMWCNIPPLPDDMKKEAAQIKRYKEQIKELRERIKKLENKEES